VCGILISSTPRPLPLQSFEDTERYRLILFGDNITAAVDTIRTNLNI